MRITASEPLSATTQELVYCIVSESRCPHESLINTFPRYAGIDVARIHFDSMDSRTYVYEINKNGET